MTVTHESGRARAMKGPESLSPREAWRKWVDRRRPDSTKHSVKSYHYRMKLFVEWCEDQNIETVSELNGWALDQYETHRRGEEIAPVTLREEMKTLRQFAEYLERIGVADDLADKVPMVNVSADEISDDTKLDVGDALGVLEYYRTNETGTRQHAFIELIWYTGARLGAIRGLDRRDFDPEDKYIEFHHRPETDTPLKKKMDGERVVGLSDDVVDALQAYLRSGDRWDKRDEHGRQPLFTTRSKHGRPGQNTVRTWSYNATIPCRYTECPHGNDPEECEWTKPQHSSKCPSSRSPHQIRTGSISWQLDCGIPPETVATRVNSSVGTIRKHYDKTSARDEMERRRRRYLDNLSLEFEP